MKRRKILSTILISIIICIIWYIIWHKAYNTNFEIQKTLQKEIFSEWIKIKESVSWINSWRNKDTWFIWINSSWEEVNVFSRIKNNKLLNLVLENSQSYDKEWIQNLLEFKWNYKIIKGSWYDRTINVIKWP